MNSTNFRIIQSTDYATIAREMDSWSDYTEKVLEFYNQQQITDTVTTEHDTFEDLYWVAERIHRIATLILSGEREIRENFFLCLGKNRLQSIAIVAKYNTGVLLDGAEQTCLPLEYLATCPTNIRATLIHHPVPEKSMEGAGSALLKYIEKEALQRNVHVVLSPLETSRQFYFKYKYDFVPSTHYMIKKKALIISEIAQDRLDQLKTA